MTERWSERSILRRVAEAAAAHAKATEKTTGRQSGTGVTLRRWLTVLDAWDCDHAGEAEPSPDLPLLEGPKNGTE